MKMSQVFSFLGGLLGGGIVGAAVVILLAPSLVPPRARVRFAG